MGIDMGIVDVHTHIFPEEMIRAREHYAERDHWFAELYANPRSRMATAEDLLASMKEAGVERSVAFGFAFRDQGLCNLCNDYVLEQAARSAGRLVPFAVANPCGGSAAVRLLEAALARGAQGIGELLPDGQGFTLADEVRLGPFLGLAHEGHVPTLLHVSEPVGHVYPGKGFQGPAEAYGLAIRHPENILVLAHWGGGLPFYELMPEVRGALHHTYYDSAASLYVYDDAIFPLASTLAPGKVLFGSDYPLLSQKRFLARVRASRLPPSALEGFLGLNAETLLGLEPLKGA